MKFRTRLLIAFGVVVMIPLLVFGLGIRREMSNRVTSEAIQLHGGFGFTDEYPVSRLYRGARYGTLGGGTSETLRDLIGKRIMDATETGAELLAYDMMTGAGVAG